MMKYNHDYIQKMVDFLEQWIAFPEGAFEHGDKTSFEFIMQGISFILKEEVFTVEELKAEVLNECEIILSDELIPEMAAI